MPPYRVFLTMTFPINSLRLPPTTSMKEDNVKADPSVHVTASDSPTTPTASEAERRLRWKIDIYTVLIVAILYALCTIDCVEIGSPPFPPLEPTRAREPLHPPSMMYILIHHLGNAHLTGLQRTLDLRGNDFNTLLLIFYISYTLFSVPMSWVTEWCGSGWALPGTET